MKTKIKVNIPYSKGVYEWSAKEHGSWEDNNRNSSHPCAILQQAGKVQHLTEEEVKALIKSGEYNSTAWSEDEIDGGRKTLQTISKITNKLKNLIK